MSLDVQKSLRAACIFVLGAVCLVIGRYVSCRGRLVSSLLSITRVDAVAPIQVYDHFLRPRWYLRNLPGPARDEFFLGNLKVLRKLAPGSVDELWHGRYGPVLKYDGYLSVRPPHIFAPYVPRALTSTSRCLVSLDFDDRQESAAPYPRVRTFKVPEAELLPEIARGLYGQWFVPC